VCGPRVEQRDEEGASYVHVDVHSPPSTWLDPGEGMDGDGWLAAIRWITDTLLIEHLFDAEEVFAVFFVSVDEELVTMEALAILAALGDLRRRQADCGHWFVDVARPTATGSSVEAGADRYEDRGVDRAAVGGTSREMLRCS
jgi:hypothetical protein